MNKNHTILISGKDPVVVKMSAMSMVSTEMHVVIGSNDQEKLAYDIEHLKPAVVLIWGVDNADDILEFVGKWEGYDVKPFFLVTTCYRRVYDLIYSDLPNNAYVILEPESMSFIWKLIKRVTDRNFDMA